MNEEHPGKQEQVFEDEKLAKAAQKGDIAAFDRLVLLHKDRIFNLCYRFLGDQQDANDAAQDVFVKVYRSIKKFRFDAALTTWLYRITTNTCLNILNSAAYKRKQRTLSLHTGKYGGEGRLHPDNFQNGKPSPESQLENKERAAMIQKAIDNLAEKQKAVIIFRDIEGLSYDEIAEVTGTNVGTVKSRLARARIALRESLRSLF